MSSGVFLSYSRTDRALADQVVRALRSIGVDVWWDQDMPGVDWQQELERQVTELSALVVLWTPASTNSEYVRDEARLALSRHKLINALSGVRAPPFPFDRINGLPIDDWNGRDSHGGWSRLVATLEEHLVTADLAKPGELTGALARREQTMQGAQSAAAAAEEAFQEAKAREAETKETASAAKLAYDSAETQFQRVAEMRVSTTVLHAAQAELDNSRAAMEAADNDRRAAAAALSAASRAVAKARNDLAHMFDRPSTIAPEPTPAPGPSPAPALPPTPVETILAPEPAPTPPPPPPPPEPVPQFAPPPPPPPPEPVPQFAPPPPPPQPAMQPPPPPPGPTPSPPVSPPPSQPTSMVSGGGPKSASNTPVIIALSAVGGLISLVVIAVLLSGHPNPPVTNGASDTTNAADNTADNTTADTNAAVATNTAIATANTNGVFDPNGPNPLLTNPTAFATDPAIMNGNARNAAAAGDLVTAAEWWSLSAEKGDADGEAGLGIALAVGKGVKMDDAAALDDFLKSANQGNVTGESWAGAYYANGWGNTPVDLTKARFWYEKAAAQGDNDARQWLSKNPE